MPEPRYELQHLIAYESGALSYQKQIELLADLTRTGIVHELQGHYERTAQDMIEQQLFDYQGTLNQDNIDAFLEGLKV